MTFSYLSLFSDPVTAFAIASIVVSGAGYSAFRIPADWPPAKAAIYWKAAAFAAEILVVVGLIGLATFAGRLKIIADEKMMASGVSQAEAAVTQGFTRVLAGYCNHTPPLPRSPFNVFESVTEICTIARSYSGVYQENIDWKIPAEQLAAFPQKYPGCTDNAIENTPSCIEIVTLATSIAADIRRMQAARLEKTDGDAMSAIVQGSSSWVFMLIAFLCAAIGVAIKCARALAELLLTLKK